jgi:SAM-dependent methyltransferase
MAAWLQLSADVEILDVGYGIGNPARLAGKRHLHERGWAGAGYGADQGPVPGPACHPPPGGWHGNGFPDSSFDCVWVMESSHLMPRNNALLAESARVLRPEGRFILCDMRCSPIRLPKLIRDLAKFKCLDAVFGKVRKMESLETHVRLAEANRLVVERVEDVSSETLPTFKKWIANAHANRDRVIELTGETYWRQFVDACDYLTTFWQSKMLGYGMLLGRKRT